MHNANCAPEGWQYTETYVGAEYIDQGYTLGQLIVEETGGKGDVVMLTGNPGQDASEERVLGIKKAFEGTDLKIIASQTAEWQKDKALVIMDDFLTRYPKIDVVIGVDDPMALGALEAIKAAGRLEEMKIYGVNGNKEAFDAIKAGEMQGTVLQLSYLFGVYALRAGYDISVGRLVPKRINVPLAGVSRKNIDKWYEYGW
jgi:ribose transport system substrate-binding protein